MKSLKNNKENKMIKIKEITRWLEAGKLKVWNKGKKWRLITPDWLGDCIYIVNDRQAELRKLTIDKPSTKIEFEMCAGLWKIAVEPTWDVGINYRVKEEEEEIKYPIFKKNKELKMTNKLEELRQEILEENHRVGQEEVMLRENLDYALSTLGMAEIYIEIEALSLALKDCGHEMSVSDLLDFMKEI